jgi:hypothetical protein
MGCIKAIHVNTWNKINLDVGQPMSLAWVYSFLKNFTVSMCISVGVTGMTLLVVHKCSRTWKFGSPNGGVEILLLGLIMLASLGCFSLLGSLSLATYTLVDS